MRALGRFFKERQIYHRSDGIVRFIKLSSQTQIALAAISAFAICWVAYASVNVVFKEQIILAKDRDTRDMEAAYRAKLDNAESSYNEVNSLNVILTEEYDSTTTQIENRLDALTAIVQQKGAIDDGFEELADTLSTVGGPGGTKLKNANRIMVDAVGREPTPRQSRQARIRDEALHEVLSEETNSGLEHSFLENMRQKTAKISARQMLILADVEEDTRNEIADIEAILKHTGVDTAIAQAKTRIKNNRAETSTLASANDFIGQGGPDTSILDSNGNPSVYYKSINRVNASLEELSVLSQLLKSVPLSNPLAVPHRLTSPFGLRRDPKNRKRWQSHDGLDLAAGWNVPILASAPGRVSFAGTRGGYGRTVEIDHGNGFKTRYAHMNKIKVRAGQKVKLHDVIGLVGNSGRSTGPHVHFEVIYNGRQVDPMKFIEAGKYVFES